MPEWPAHQKSIAKWVKAVLPDRTGTLDNAHGVAQGAPWFMVRLLSSRSLAPPEKRIGDAGGGDQSTETIDRKAGTVSITLAEGAHHDDADLLTASLGDPEIILLLESSNLSVTRHLSTAHRGSDSDGTTQNRSVVDFEFTYSISRSSTSSEAAQEATASGSIT